MFLAQKLEELVKSRFLMIAYFLLHTLIIDYDSNSDSLKHQS